jgi:hypothetical protein
MKYWILFIENGDTPKMVAIETLDFNDEQQAIMYADNKNHSYHNTYYCVFPCSPLKKTKEVPASVTEKIGGYEILLIALRRARNKM